MLIEKQFGDIITFTRASAATRVNAQGLIETVAANVPRIDYDASGALTNQMTWSHDLSNAGWSLYGSAAKSGQTLLLPVPGDNVVHGATTGIGVSTFAAELSGVGTISLFAWNPTDGWIGITQFALSETPTIYAKTFNLTEQYSFFYIARRAGDTAVAVNVGGAGVFNGELTAAQISGYGGIPKTTSAPALDPSKVVCKGLLIEEQRTNLEPYSNLSTDWAINYGTVVITPGQADPSGGSTAVRLDGSGSWSWGKTVSGLPAEGTYTGSFYIKADAAGAVDLQIFDGSTVTTISKPVTTQWTRIDGQKQIAGSVFRLAVAKSSSQSVTVAFAQVEAGSFATSYIPTAGAQVTRAADVAMINPLSPWWNASEGTVVIDYKIPSQQNVGLLAVRGDSENNFHIWSGGENNAQFERWIGGAAVHPAVMTNIVPGEKNKIAISYSIAGSASCANGGVVTSAAGGAAQNFTNLRLFGNRWGSSLNNASGYALGLRYFPKRLSNAQLQALTA